MWGVARIFEMAIQSILRIVMPWAFGRKGQAHVKYGTNAEAFLTSLKDYLSTIQV